MPFHDLNIPYTSNHIDLSHNLSFHDELGYAVIAIALSVTAKLPAAPQIIPLHEITLPKGMTALTRLTLTISDTTQNHRLASLQPHYDIIALRPTTEKALQLCCGSLECDLISLDLSQRIPFILKFKTVASALQRGVRFEIGYSPGIADGSDARRNVISGAAALIRATRGRGIILSSEARNALGVRGPYDVMNLAHVWGLGQERGKEGLCEEAAKVVRLAGLKRTSFRGVVDIIDGGGRPSRVQKSHEQQAISEQTMKSTGVDSLVAKRTESPASNGIKRKASASSLITATPAQPSADEKPLSKREQKRRAKKARLEGHTTAPDAVKSDTVNPNDKKATVDAFPIKHESMMANLPAQRAPQQQKLKKKKS